MKVVVLLSGGADSCATYVKLKEDGHFCKSIFFDYGQPNAEVEQHFATLLDPAVDVFDIEGLLVPMRMGSKSNDQAFVPHRNTLFMFLAAIQAEKIQADAIAIGFMEQDTAFFDNSILHHKWVEGIISKNVNRDVKVLIPFWNKTKKDVISFLNERGVLSVSCWSAKMRGMGTEVCGKCANCLERIAAGG